VTAGLNIARDANLKGLRSLSLEADILRASCGLSILTRLGTRADLVQPTDQTPRSVYLASGLPAGWPTHEVRQWKRRTFITLRAAAWPLYFRWKSRNWEVDRPLRLDRPEEPRERARGRRGIHGWKS
jgi:hypothetical protein